MELGCEVVVSATFTIDPLGSVCDFWSSLFERINVKLTDYNSVLFQLLNPASDFCLNSSRTKVNVIIFRIDDLIKQSSIDQFTLAVKHYLAGGYSATLMIIEAKPSAEYQQSRVRENVIDDLMKMRSTNEKSQMKVYQHNEIESIFYGNVLDVVFDEDAEKLAGIPYIQEYYSLLGTFIFRKVWVNFVGNSAFKVFVLDCDNTLWGGILNELSPEAIQITDQYIDLQERMVGQYKSGRLLCINSSNDLKDVVRVFETRNEMRIKRDMITAWKVNWQPKMSNIRKLSELLNLGLDSFVFIDDDHVNVYATREGIPQVVSLQLPDNEESAKHFLHACWLFDKLDFLTEADDHRQESYKQNIQRAELENDFNDQGKAYVDFLASLEMKITMVRIDDSVTMLEKRRRVIQMTQRTNRFNATTIRMNDNDLKEWTSDVHRQCFCFDVSDKFGSYGIAAAVFVEISVNSNFAAVNNFLMSCRVLNRGAEYTCLKLLVTELRKYDIKMLKLNFCKSEKNDIVFNYFLKLNSLVGCANDNCDFVFSLDDLEDISYEKLVDFNHGNKNLVDAELSNANLEVKSSGKNPEKSAVDDFKYRNNILIRICTELNSLDKVHSEISRYYSTSSENRHNPTTYNNKLSRIQSQCVYALQEVLGRSLSAANMSTPLFNLGLTSLSAVLFTAKLMKLFPDLKDHFSTTLVFERPTLKSIIDYISALGPVEKPTSIRNMSPHIAGTSDAVKDNNAWVISSMACRFPGGVSTPLQFWHFLSRNKCAHQTIPENRWDVNNPLIYPEDCGSEVKFLHPVENVSWFDNKMFGISDAEARLMDPQQRMAITVVYEALLRAEITSPTKDPSIPKEDIHRFHGAKVGVFVAYGHSDWSLLHASLPDSEMNSLSTYSFAGRLGSITSGRISFTFGLTGPSMNIDTACSSSLVAVNEALKSLQDDECDSAVVVGVNLNLHPETYIQLSRAKQLSTTGYCKTFDADADGFARGEGCGAIVIQRKKDAITSLATIETVALNNDGRSASLPAPNGTAQRDCLKLGLQRAKLSTNDIIMVETHGSGTQLGDAIEFNSLRSVFQANDFLSLGAVKSNIGHLEAAAGMAGLIKTVLSLCMQEFLPNAHLQRLSPKLDTYNFQVHFPSEPVAFKNLIPRREKFYAGVSAFGMSGTNAFLIVGSDSKFSLEDLENTYCLNFTPSPILAKDFPLPKIYSYKGKAAVKQVASNNEIASKLTETMARVKICLQEVVPDLASFSMDTTFTSILDSLGGIEFSNALVQVFPEIDFIKIGQPSMLIYTFKTVGDLVTMLDTVGGQHMQSEFDSDEEVTNHVDDSMPTSNILPNTSPNKRSQIDSKLDGLFSQLFEESTLKDRLENRLLERLLDRWDENNTLEIDRDQDSDSLISTQY